MLLGKDITLVCAILATTALHEVLGRRVGLSEQGDEQQRLRLDSLSNFSWSRDELVEKLQNQYTVGDLQVSPYSVEKDGLLWTGSSWHPDLVFQEGFKKTPSKEEDDPDENLMAWGDQISRSVAANGWTYGFHLTVNPRVAAQFGVYHVARSQRLDGLSENECDGGYQDIECNRELLKRFQHKYGCPADDAPVMQVDEGCYGGPCLRVDKLDDADEGIEGLCPNWGYAYLVKAPGVHVRVSAAVAMGKDYSAEEEVFVPMGIEGHEVLGAIPIYARKEDGSRKNPGMTDFAAHWNGQFGFDKMKVPAVHTRDGKGSSSGIGAFIFNNNYAGDAQEEVAAELARKGIDKDLGTAVPRET